jgi:hypothetical protein
VLYIVKKQNPHPELLLNIHTAGGLGDLSFRTAARDYQPN